jgi:hypothetical protein
MKRLALVAVLSVFAMLVAAAPVGAGISWCRTDPVFSLDGKVGHVYLSTHDGLQRLNNSSLDVVIAHPHKVATKLLAIDGGFGQGMSVNFKEARQGSTDLLKTAAGYEIEVWTYVPASDSSMPILVEFAPGDGSVVTAAVVGRANQWIVLRAILP